MGCENIELDDQEIKIFGYRRRKKGRNIAQEIRKKIGIEINMTISCKEI